MLKLKSGNKILLGIDKENVKRLKKGSPILVKGDDIGLKEDIIIAYGDTLKNITDELNIKVGENNVI
jgi:hypothetical protein